MPTLIQKLVSTPGDDLIVVLELNGLIIRDCNVSFEMWSHTQRKDILGTSFFDHVSVLQAEKLETRILKNLNEHRIWVEEFKNLHYSACFHFILWKKENLILWEEDSGSATANSSCRAAKSWLAPSLSKQTLQNSFHVNMSGSSSRKTDNLETNSCLSW